MRQAGYIMGGDYGEDGGGMCCQDCGNKAKKECQHMRCRTCCRNRGFRCETHVKSTWVPAAKRRERHQQQKHSSNEQLSLMISSGSGGGGGGGGAEDNATALRDDRQHHHHVHGGVVVPTVNHQNTSSELGFNFPTELSSPTLFQRVRVRGIDETNEQFAYQTAISVEGHVFNGILYDHGPDLGQYSHPVGGSISDASGNQHQDVSLVTSGTTATDSNNIYQAVTVIDPSSVYPTPLCAFSGSMQFFPPPRS